MPPTGLYRLLEALEERGVPLRHDDIAWAFENEHTRRPVVGWMREHLVPTNLLTKEEVAFHQAMPSGIAGFASASTRHIQDTELEATVASLEASTAAIDRQCLLLEEQKRALSAFQAQNVTNAKPPLRSASQTQLQRQKAQLEFEIRQLSDGIAARARQAGKVADAAEANLPSAVARGLERDNRVLDGFVKLNVQTAGGRDHGPKVEEIEELSLSLSTLMAEDIKGRVDEAFLSSLARDLEATKTNDQADPERVATLRAELDDLSGEIDGLISIVVDQQYHQPITSALGSSYRSTKAHHQQEEAYIRDSLQHLLLRCEGTDSYAQQLQAYQTTMRLILLELRDVDVDPRKDQSFADVRPGSPERQSKGLKPLRLLQRTTSSSSGHPVTRILQHLSLPSLPPNATADTVVLDAYLRKTVGSLPEAQPTAEALNRALAQHMSGANMDREALLNAVYLHSIYGGPRLAGESLVEGVEGLGESTKELGDQMRYFDFEKKLVEAKGLAREFAGNLGSL